MTVITYDQAVAFCQRIGLISDSYNCELVLPALDDFLKSAIAQPAQTATCLHSIADARNPVVQSGYICIKCGALFSAADHDQLVQPDAPVNHAEAKSLAYIKRHESNLARCYLDLCNIAQPVPPIGGEVSERVAYLLANPKELAAFIKTAEQNADDYLALNREFAEFRESIGGEVTDAEVDALVSKLQTAQFMSDMPFKERSTLEIKAFLSRRAAIKASQKATPQVEAYYLNITQPEFKPLCTRCEVHGECIPLGARGCDALAQPPQTDLGSK